MDSDKQKDVSGGAIFSGNAKNSGTEPNAISSGSIAADAQAAGMPHSFSAHRPTKVITNVSGDVVLSDANQKTGKSKLPLVLIIAIVIIIGIAVAFFLLFSNSGKVDAFKNSYYSFVNLLIQGEESSNEPIETDDYFAEDVIAGGLYSGYTEDDIAYIDHLISSYASFKNQFDSASNSEASAELITKVDDFQQYIEFLENIRSYKGTGQSDLISAMRSEGVAAGAAVIEQYESMTSSENSNIGLFYQSVTTNLQNYYNFYAHILESGCTLDENTFLACLSSKGLEVYNRAIDLEIIAASAPQDAEVEVTRNILAYMKNASLEICKEIQSYEN